MCIEWSLLGGGGTNPKIAWCINVHVYGCIFKEILVNAQKLSKDVKICAIYIVLVKNVVMKTIWPPGREKGSLGLTVAPPVVSIGKRHHGVHWVVQKVRFDICSIFYCKSTDCSMKK